VVVVLCADGSVFIRAEMPTSEQGIIGFLRRSTEPFMLPSKRERRLSGLHDLIEPFVSSVTACRGLPRALELARQLRSGDLRAVVHGYSSNLRHLRHLVPRLRDSGVRLSADDAAAQSAVPRDRPAGRHAQSVQPQAQEPLVSRTSVGFAKGSSIAATALPSCAQPLFQPPTGCAAVFQRIHRTCRLTQAKRQSRI
jgi:hypothetical protein